MAVIVECSFCKGDAVNYDHGECAIGFFNNLQHKIIDWHLNNQGKPLPDSIESELRGEKWQNYQSYLKRVKRNEEDALRAKRYAFFLQPKLQKIGDEEIKKLDPRFQVSVQVACSLVPVF